MTSFVGGADVAPDSPLDVVSTAAGISSVGGGVAADDEADEAKSVSS